MTHRFCTLALIFLNSLCSCACADLVLPDGLNPGDQYRIVFVTEGVRDATSINISDYNQFVSDEANRPGSLVSGLNVDWTAIGSTASVNARTNSGTDPTPSGPTGVPIFRVDGTTKVADDYDDLWDGTVDEPITLDQFGTMVSSMAGKFVFTGTNVDGLSSAGSELGDDNSVLTGFSFPGVTDFNWSGSLFLDSSVPRSLYGISGVLTAVPEPSALLLFSAIALASLTKRPKRGDAIGSPKNARFWDFSESRLC